VDLTRLDPGRRAADPGQWITVFPDRPAPDHGGRGRGRGGARTGPQRHEYSTSSFEVSITTPELSITSLAGFNGLTGIVTHVSIAVAVILLAIIFAISYFNHSLPVVSAFSTIKNIMLVYTATALSQANTLLSGAGNSVEVSNKAGEAELASLVTLLN